MISCLNYSPNRKKSKHERIGKWQIIGNRPKMIYSNARALSKFFSALINRFFFFFFWRVFSHSKSKFITNFIKGLYLSLLILEAVDVATRYRQMKEKYQTITLKKKKIENAIIFMLVSRVSALKVVPFCFIDKTDFDRT